MDIDLSDIQTVVLTPVAPAIIFAAVVGFVFGAIATAASFAFEYQRNGQWPNKKIALKFATFSVVLFELFTVGLAAMQLSENPTIPLESVYKSTQSNAALLCAVLSLSNWQSSKTHSLFGEASSPEQTD